MHRLLVGLVVVASLGQAASADDKKQAGIHLKQGAAYYKAEQYDAAVAEFKKSYALDKKPQTLFNIANAYYKKQDYKSAIEFFQSYLAADPDGRFAKEALEFTAIANKALTDADQKQRAAAATARVRQAEAFAKAGAWGSAGDEYRAAAEGDPVHLITAADMYRKQPDLPKARDAYRAYLAKVSLGGRSDEVRTKLAEIARELDAKTPSAAPEPTKTVAEVVPEAEAEPDVEEPPPPPPPFRRGWSRLGARVAVNGSQGDTNPLQMRSDGLVFGLGFEVGAYARYDVWSRFALRPELSLIYQTTSFDSGIMNDAVDIERAGALAIVPVVFALTRGTVRVQLVAGLFLGLMPHAAAHDNMPPDPQLDGSFFEPGGVGGLLFDFGSRVSIEVRFRYAFQAVASNFETALQTGSVGVGFSFLQL